MKRLGIVSILLVCATAASAQNVRTYVSNVGVDSGTTCASTAPCRTIQYALNLTNSGGDVVVQTSGTYGSSLVIDRAINIIVPDAIWALMNNSGTNSGIYVNAGASDVVRIKGLNILSTANNQGVGLNVGTCKRTEYSNAQITRVGYGVYIGVDTRLTLDHVTITDVTTGIWCIGSGTSAQAFPNQHLGPFLRVVVTNSVIRGASTGVKLDAGSFEMGNDNIISFCTTDAYMIQAGVPSCSYVTNNGLMNHFTGVCNPNCAACGCGNVQDLRNGMTQTGDCEY